MWEIQQSPTNKNPSHWKRSQIHYMKTVLFAELNHTSFEYPILFCTFEYGVKPNSCNKANLSGTPICTES